MFERQPGQPVVQHGTSGPVPVLAGPVEHRLDVLVAQAGPSARPTSIASISRPPARAAMPGSAMTPIRRMVRVVIGLAIRLPSSFRQVAVRMSGVPRTTSPSATAAARRVSASPLGTTMRSPPRCTTRPGPTRSAAMYARAGTTQWLRTKGDEAVLVVESVLGGRDQGSVPAEPVQPGCRSGRVTHLGGHPDDIGRSAASGDRGGGRRIIDEGHR